VEAGCESAAVPVPVPVPWALALALAFLPRVLDLTSPVPDCESDPASLLSPPALAAAAFAAAFFLDFDFLDPTSPASSASCDVIDVHANTPAQSRRHTCGLNG